MNGVGQTCRFALPTVCSRFQCTISRPWELSMNRGKHRQVLDCGDEVFEVAALDREPAWTGRAGPLGEAEAKAVNRFARHRTPRRCRARLRFVSQCLCEADGGFP